MHGRDALDVLWPEFYMAVDREELPAEEFHSAKAGANIGWPYTYYDHRRSERMTKNSLSATGFHVNAMTTLIPVT